MHGPYEFRYFIMEFRDANRSFYERREVVDIRSILTLYHFGIEGIFLVCDTVES